MARLTPVCGLWDDPLAPLTGPARIAAEHLIRANHYLHSFPAGKTFVFECHGALVCYSIPANPYIARFMLGYKAAVWELSRLWAPDGHAPNALSAALALSVTALRRVSPKAELLVSYADPHAGHTGGVYRAASWVYTGRAADGRNYRDKTGRLAARRKFHSGANGLTKAAIAALGWEEIKLPGKHRFCKGLTRRARNAVRRRWGGGIV